MQTTLRNILLLLSLFACLQSNAQHRKKGRSSLAAVSKPQLTAPHFPGGDSTLHEYLRNRIRYPMQAMENDIEGTVRLMFFINEKGIPEDIRITREIGGGCGKEAVRVVQQMPAWIPGTYAGKKVKMIYELPVSFKLRY